MPLDNSLDNDLKSSHLHHCAVNAHLPKYDIRRHSMATPQYIDRDIRWIWNYSQEPPTSARTLQDFSLVITSMEEDTKSRTCVIKMVINMIIGARNNMAERE